MNDVCKSEDPSSDLSPGRIQTRTRFRSRLQTRTRTVMHGATSAVAERIVTIGLPLHIQCAFRDRKHQVHRNRVCKGCILHPQYFAA